MKKKKTMDAKAKSGMKRQLVAQLRKKIPQKPKELDDGDARKQTAEGFAMSEAELKGQLSRNALERAEVEVFSCKDCGAELEYNDRSVLVDGEVVHIGCPKAPTRKGGEPERKRALAGLPKHEGVAPPELPKPVERKHGSIVPMADYQGRTCIQLERGVSTVTYVDISTRSFGMHLQYMPLATFDARFKPLDGYPTEKAVKKYLEFCKEYGATQDVLDWLGRVVKPTEEEMDMAKKKAKQSAEAPKGKEKKLGKAKRGGAAPRGGIGDVIREMIGKGQDAEAIVKAVKAKFPGAKTSPANVSWYKNDMRKKGMKVPERKPQAA